MKRYEKTLLKGVFFMMIALFLPWLGYIKYYYADAKDYLILNFGYNTVQGWIIFILALAIAVIALMPKKEIHMPRILAALILTVCVAGCISIIDAYIHLFVLMNDQYPHAGPVSALFGCIVVGKGILKGYIGDAADTKK